MNLKLSLFIISLLTAFGCMGSLNAGPFSSAQAPAKPQSPVTVSIQPAARSSSGKVIDFIVSATSQIGAQQFAIIVYPPKDMQLISGDLSWRGPVRRGQTKTLRFSGSFQQSKDQRILVSAVIQSASGPRFAARASYVVTPSGDNAKALSESQPGSQQQGSTTQRGDRTVIEYPVSH